MSYVYPPKIENLFVSPVNFQLIKITANGFCLLKHGVIYNLYLERVNSELRPKEIYGAFAKIFNNMFNKQDKSRRSI